MKILDLLGSFKRDFKRISKRGWDIDKLSAVVVTLRRAEPLSVHARPHKLSGEWLGFWECHVAPDWLLIYDTNDATVLLARTGTHQDLFDN
ncbi:MAG TPA: type II toxin-antitoxin system YafQ family toxin [Candidatus Paceibacterota bacterium]